MVNIDENAEPVVAQLAAHVPHVIVTHPLAPRDNLALYRLFGGIFGAQRRAGRLCAQFEHVWAAATAVGAELPRRTVLYLIWRDPWMTVRADTYISGMLALVGWDTLPAQSNDRYPAIALDASLLATVDHVLLSTEPYRFRARDVGFVRSRLPLNAGTRVHLVDGTMTSWYGNRAIHGIEYLVNMRRELG